MTAGRLEGQLVPRCNTRGGAAAVMAPPTAPLTAAPATMRTIDPCAVGTLAEWGQYLGLPRNCLKREARLARLRMARLWLAREGSSQRRMTSSQS